MRILIVPSSYRPEVGGVQSVVMNLALRAKQAGHEVVVVTTRSKGLPATDVFDGVPVHRLPFVAPEVSRHLAAFVATFAESLGGLRRIMADFKPDVLNAHFVSTGNSLFAVVASGISRVPLVASVHGEDVLSMPVRSRTARLISKTALRSCAAATACSQYMAEAAAGLAGVSPSKISVIRNGVDLEEFSQADTVRSGVFSLGRFVEKKGFDILISAFGLVRAHLPTARLILAGDGPERANLEGMVAALNLGDSVEFLGTAARTEVVRRLKACGVFVLPSRREPLGITVLEAMAAGAPVVAARVGGVPELVEHDGNGLLVSPNDPVQMADAIVRLIRSAELSRHLAAEGRRMVEEAYGWEHAARRFLTVFESAMAQPGNSICRREEVRARGG